MENGTMDLQQLATFLHRDVRELLKLASRGYLPGRRVGGQWRFAPAEINNWLEKQMSGYTDQELTALERGAGRTSAQQPLIAPLLSENTMAVPLVAATKASVLKELVSLAERSWLVYDAEAILHTIRQREEMGSTALDCGVALPHPSHPMPGALGDSVIAYGRTASGIPFGGPMGQLTDIFFLILCRDYGTHLRVLARLSRMLMRPKMIEALRGANTWQESYQLLEAVECELPSME